MSKHNKSYRIRANVNADEQVINLHLTQEYEKFEILSLTINQTNSYHLMNSKTGIVVGRVLANEGFGIPNAKISVFIQYDGTDIDSVLQYQYGSFMDTNDKGVRYNLLPDKTNDNCHQDVGSFPTKRYLLDNNDVIEVFDKYYTYTTKTNNSGDYMIYGVPTGQQTIHCDIDLSDIGVLSQTPRDMMYKGSNAGMFESPTKFKYSTNLNSLPQIITENQSVYVYPFWGDTTDNEYGAAVTRCDINISYQFEPTCVFLGSVITDTGDNSISKKCVPSKVGGKMAELTTGSGMIEMIRKTTNGDVEQISIKGNEVIDENGVWCYQIPMNLDYVMTDEYGNTVLSDNPKKGIATRARVRFRVSMHENPADGTARKRARFLVPNNPRLVNDDYPKFTETKAIDYEFGSKTREEDFRDLMWNNVYTVKSYIPRIQKARLPNNLRHLGIKMTNHSGSNNPMPYNKLSIKFNFMYTFMCVLIKVLIQLTRFANTVLYGVNMMLLRLAHGMVAISNRWFWPKKLTMLAGINGKTPDNASISSFKWTFPSGKMGEERTYDGCYGFNTIDTSKLNDKDTEDNGLDALWSFIKGILRGGGGNFTRSNRAAWCAVAYFLYKSCNYTKNGGDKWDFNALMKSSNINGLAAICCALVNAIGRGIVLEGLCDDDNGNSIDITPGPNPEVNNFLRLVVKNLDCYQSDSNISLLYNCVENQLAQDNEVTSFNFYNDWVNGVLYFPLWYRRIRPKKKFWFIKLESKDQWCNGDANALGVKRRKLKVYNNCVTTRTTTTDSLKPLNDDYPTVNVPKSKANDETGREDLEFKTKSETNCYGYKCHTYGRTETPIYNGLIIAKETMLGEMVYYYKPTYISKNEPDLVTLFATDLVLLGSLKECDIHGIPQFFKILEGTSYQMPPDLLSEDYEYLATENGSSDKNSDETENQLIDESTRHTEYTGADWGNLGIDQSNYQQEAKLFGAMVKYEANENIYDNGGLFYGLTCFESYTKPKTIINLERICEIGVALDETQDVLKSKLVYTTGVVGDDESQYVALTPDGYISYDDIYNPDYRSMFATLNSNSLKTKKNYDTGLTEYDLTHQYVDNFDGSLSNIMAGGATHGTLIVDGVDTKEYANYVNNSKLEALDHNYLMFRYGDYRKKNGKKCYYYQYDKTMTKIKFNKKKIEIKSKNKFPRYENSFYFYFGLKEGNTAIDQFYSSYYASCEKNAVYGKAIDIDYVGNDWCSDTGGYIKFDVGVEIPLSLELINKDNETITYKWENITKDKFYVGCETDSASVSGYKYYDFEDTTVDHIITGDYTVKIIDSDGTLYTDSVSFYNTNVASFEYSKSDFNVSNAALMGVYGADGNNVFTYITNDKTGEKLLVDYSDATAYGYVENNRFVIGCIVSSNQGASSINYKPGFSNLDIINMTLDTPSGTKSVTTFTLKYYKSNNTLVASVVPGVDSDGNVISNTVYEPGYCNLEVTEELTVNFYNTVASDGSVMDGVLTRKYYGYIAVNEVNLTDFRIYVTPTTNGVLDGFTGAMCQVLNGNITSSGYGYLGYDLATDTYYFGVPYGNINYTVRVVMLCERDDKTVDEIANEASITCTVYEGIFKMYINGIDYDTIKKFKTGWANVNMMLPSRSFFSANYIVGWDDIENIGVTNYDTLYPFEPEIVVDSGTETGYAVNNVDVINRFGNALCEYANGIGSPYQPTKDCAYTWFDDKVINQNEWDELTDDFELVEDDEGRMPTDPGYIPTFDGDIFTKCELINKVISNRIEHTRNVIGAFRANSNGMKDIAISYQSKSTPIRYCIINDLKKEIKIKI